MEIKLVLSIVFLLSFGLVFSENKLILTELIRYKSERGVLFENKNAVSVVIGNESGDLDSVVSAIARAIYLDLENGYRSSFPVINFPRHQFSVRKEVGYLFELLHIDVNELVFAEDLGFENCRISVHLCDHNILAPHQKKWTSSVVSIVDHHIDEKIDYPQLKNKEIYPVGSATTLVADRLLTKYPKIVTSEFAVLLLAPILFDTTELTNTTHTTNLDREVVGKLKAIAGDALPLDFCEKLYRFHDDITDMTPLMVMERDTKRYLIKDETLAITILPRGFELRKEYKELLAESKEMTAMMVYTQETDSDSKFILLKTVNQNILDVMEELSNSKHLLSDYGIFLYRVPKEYGRKKIYEKLLESI